MKPRSFTRKPLLLAAVLAACSLVTACNRNDPTAQPASAPAPAAALPVIAAAPAWQLTTLDGKAIGTEQLKGKVVVVDFWATWCGPCIHEIPGYIALQKKYADRGLVIVGLSVDQQGADTVSKFISARGINYPVALATPEVISAFGDIEAIPTTILIDRDGNIRHRKVGAMETADYEKLLVSVL
jgi:thiol-disulfide isomerase/thioredoxin